VSNKPKWEQRRGGLHELWVDGKRVAIAERGAETRTWYATTWAHDEQSCSRVETLALAKKAAERQLAQA